ncbi:N(2)-acetyl-L-2,4-diaminobutanoate deacetylase DoeB2 [Spirochaeta africana]|uniref:Amidohydrolase n=1 Tax=Spirochaeta africana (strain ATCC 700263 / DSM 8902 / Z-7692) TaxID=889378 RepID=H9UFJ6_SPIAZ|nr:N(2)-acetyl-L-2,4-diaminobutanoate deacetylase DoeB2 [Spirochaeta africana]AFG36289.1 amidohydrolase [Spirochaeta africana DSM 8902]
MSIYPVHGSWETHVEAATAFRRQLHQHPELTWQEHNTATAIRQSLDALGIPWSSCAGTGTIARLHPDSTEFPDAADRPTIALRADIDALPITEPGDLPWRSRIDGCMHACGHDGHTAALMLCASWLSENPKQLANPVTLLFQPAEEGGHGAREMIRDGALDNVDRIFGWHNWPAIPFGRAICPDGPVMSANATFTIDIHGVGGHSSQPELCRDPVLAGSEIVTSLQQLVSRRLPPQTPAVVSVTSFDAVSAPTVIRETARLEGSIRVADSTLTGHIGDLIHEIATAAAASCGTTAVVAYHPRYSATVNHPDAAAPARQVLAEVLGADCSHTDIQLPLMASEDFSYYLEQIPGAFMLIGSAVGGRYATACHNPGYEFNDDLLPAAARCLLQLAGCPDPTDR